MEDKDQAIARVTRERDAWKAKFLKAAGEHVAAIIERDAAIAKMGPGSSELIDTITAFSARSREEYANTKEWTIGENSSCETIRVPVALLNRIRDLAEVAKV